MPTTYSNALKYIVANQALNAEQLGYVDSVIRGSQLTKMIPIITPSKFMEDEYYEKKLAGTSVIGGRLLNQNPSTAMVNKYEKKLEHTILAGGKAEIDYKTLQAKPNELDKRVEDTLFDLGFWLDYKIINGDPDTDNGATFPGLKARLTGNQLIDNGSALSIGSSAANFRTFMSMFRTAKRRIKPAPNSQLVAVMNETIYEKVQMGRDITGANVLGTAYSDILNEEVETLAGVPLVIVRTDDIGTEILPMTESSSTSSIYMMQVGGAPTPDSLLIPGGIVGLSEGGVQMTPEVDGNIRTVTLDYEYGIRVPAKSACRIQLIN